jgi:hypothetical protein
VNRILPFLLFISISIQGYSQNQNSAKEAITKAYGIEHWEKVNEISFTFNVDRGDTHYERSFIWEPKTGKVTYIKGSDTLKYNHRNPKGEKEIAADQAFINDKYWLLAPFQLAWDSGITFSEVKKAKAPISNKKLKKLTITYPLQGGYTPGDAYDFYFDENFIIQEWVYREGNQDSPSMMNTWEDNKDVNGILLSTMHKNSSGDFKLYFTNISIK